MKGANKIFSNSVGRSRCSFHNHDCLHFSVDISSPLTLLPEVNMSSQSALDPLFMLISHSLANLQDAFNKVPGSQVITRYVVSSHQNDPGRTILELILVIFAVRTLLQSRTRTDRTAKHFIKFNDKVRDTLRLSYPYFTEDGL